MQWVQQRANSSYGAAESSGQQEPFSVLHMTGLFPIGSMYAIYANIGGILMVNVTIYTIHGNYGFVYVS